MDFKSTIRENWLGISISVVAAFLLFPNYIFLEIIPIADDPMAIWNTLDPSWLMALGYAKSEGLAWGTDFTFTYGPLAYLATRVGWGADRFSFLIFDLFVCLNFCSIFFLTYTRSASKVLTTLLIVATTTILPFSFGGGYSFVLLLFLVFWILEGLTRNMVFIWVMQIVLVCLLFYIKFNTGLIAIVFFTCGIIYGLLFTSKSKLLLIGYFFIGATALFVTSLFLNVSLVPYAIAGMELISGYNEVMYLSTGLDQHRMFAHIVIVCFALLFIFRFVFDRRPLPENAFTLFLLATVLFVLYKQSFVRADLGHVLEFFSYFILVVLCFKNLHYPSKAKWVSAFPVIAVGIGFYVIADYNSTAVQVWKKASIAKYASQFGAFTASAGNHLTESSDVFPAGIKSRIGTATIDTYPWDVSTLLENGFNYLPRPICQSYSAYTPRLEKLNFDHYNSENAPQFVLYDYVAIDNRYPLFDESKVNLLLLKNYRCVDTLLVNKRPVLLLEKSRSTKFKFVKIREYETSINTPLVPKEGHFYEIKVNLAAEGKLISVLDHTPEIQLEVRAGGKSTLYRTSKSLLESGIFGVRHIRGIDDYRKLQKAGLNEPESVISAFYIRPSNHDHYDQTIEIAEYKFKKQ